MNMGSTGGERYLGKRAVIAIRVSSDTQVDFSPDDQRRLMQAHAERLGIDIVGEVLEDGISGSIPGARTVFGDLLRRKREQDDFEVLLLQDASRLTRGGPLHGAKVEYDLAAEGIEVVFATGDVPHGPYRDIMRVLMHQASNEHARAISLATTRGAQSSLESKRTPHTRTPPHGIDRLIRSADGRPLFRLRNLTDGSQLKLAADPQDDRVLDRYPRRPKKGADLHYHKHPTERVELIRGHERALDDVRLIYKRYFVDGWGTRRIARELNEGGRPAPRGGPWGTNSVVKILRNPIYCGVGIANREATGVFHIRDVNAPRPLERPLSELAKNKRPPRRIRDRADWRANELPELGSILDAKVRELAWGRQQQWFAEELAKEKPKPNRNKHRDSGYLLTGLLMSKDGHPMVGKCSVRRGRKHRTYAVTHRINYPGAPGDEKKRSVQAEPIERFVAGVVEKVLRAAPDLRGLVERQVAAQMREHERRGQCVDVESVKQRLATVETKIDFILDHLADLGKEGADRRLAEAKREREALERELREAAPATPVKDHKAVVEHVLRDLQQFGDQWAALPREQVRRLLAAVVASLSVEPATGSVELVLRLPKWAKGTPDEVRLDATHSHRSANEAYSALPLLRFRGVVVGNRGRWTVLAYGMAA